MGSSLGGFLIGVGATLLAFSLVALFLVQSIYVPIYSYVEKYKPYLLEARKMLASPEAENLVSTYVQLVRAVKPEELESFTREASEIIGYVETVLNSSSLSNNASSYLADLHVYVSGYNSSYSRLELLRLWLNELGAWIDSEDFNETLEALSQLASEKGQGGAISGYIEAAEKAYTYLRELRNFYFKVRESLSELNAPTPQTVSELLKSLSHALELKAYLQQNREALEELDRLTRFLSSEDFSRLVEAYKKIRDTIPPEKLQEMLLDAQAALDKAISLANTVEALPPRYVLNVLYVLVAFEILLSAAGVHLCLRNKNN